MHGHYSSTAAGQATPNYEEFAAYAASRPSDIDNRTIWVTRFEDTWAKSKMRLEEPLSTLREIVSKTSASTKEELPLAKLAVFGDNRSKANSLRHDANVKEISGVETDYDGGLISFEVAVAAIKKADIRALLYTTPSHHPLKPHWRIFAPLSCHLPPADHAGLVARLNGLFNGALAPESFTLSQAYYYGSVGKNPEHKAVVVDGDFIDWRDDLDAGAVGKEPDRPANGGEYERFTEHGEELTGSDKFRKLNDAALANLPAWVPELFPGAKLRGDSYRISSKTLGRDLEEDLSITPKGIKDWGVWDIGDERKGKRTPIDLVIEHRGKDFKEAVAWLRERLGMPDDAPPPDVEPDAEPNANSPNNLKNKGGFAVGSNGIPHSSQGNIRLALEKLGITVRHNLFEDRSIIEGLKNFELLNDAAMDRLWLTVDEKFRFRPAKDFFWTVVFDEARRNSFHPICEYLDGLRWDGVKRIDGWLIDYAGADDSKYVRAVGALTLIAAVRRIRSPGCKFDEMPVLQSKQGFNKSTALSILAVKPEWFSDDLPLNADSKKTIERLRGHWIVEAAELKGMRNGDVEHLKSFLSRTRDRARMSYDRTNTELLRQCVIIGTTNHEKFLRDQTGNRRFWPVRNVEFDLTKLKQDRDQLWAEAAAREAEGTSIRLAKDLWTDATVEQEEHTVDEPWIEVIQGLLIDKDGKLLKGKLLSADAWLLVGMTAEKRTQTLNERLGIAMRACGWERAKRRFKEIDGVCHAYVPLGTAKGEALSRISVDYDSRFGTTVQLVEENNKGEDNADDQ